MKIAAHEMKQDFKTSEEVAVANEGLISFLVNLSKFKVYEKEKDSLKRDHPNPNNGIST